MIATDTKVEVLAGGFTWTEGPVWVDEQGGGHLLFWTFPATAFFVGRKDAVSNCSCIRAVTPEFRTTGRNPVRTGCALDGEGRLTACEHGDRRVSVLTRGGGKRTLVDRYEESD